MARLDSSAERPLPLHPRRDSKDSGAALDEEKRAAAPVDEDDLGANDVDDERADDDKSVAVLSRDDLEPFADDSDAQVLERLAVAIQNLREQDDWLVQHEATATLRRVIVHHPQLVAARHVDAFLDLVVLGCDNLRSALSKNSLLALAEGFERLGAAHAPRFLAHRALLDVLLRRAACEKQFLRDAAAFAAQQLAAHLASWELLAAAGAYARAKSARLCGCAARVAAAALLQLQREGAVARLLADGDDGAARLRALCVALAAFHGARDKRARLEAAAAFRVLADALGAERFERAVRGALAADPLAAARVVKEALPPAPAAALARGRRGSLRERMALEAAASVTAGSSDQ